MSEAISIKRRKTTDSETSFDSLRSEAIKLIEQISGQVWTDYNLHDPGITILEQLIYALTDLIYRAELAVEDILVRENGQIDFDYQALHVPEKVFPCRPTTILDYRKVFFNAVNEIDNVWLTIAQDSEYQGLYKIFVKLEPGLDDEAISAALDKLRAIYNRSRNLCEDIDEICVAENIEYELGAQIEVRGSHYPADILAEIYFKCSRRIAGSVSNSHFEPGLDKEVPLDELFTGPFTEHGFFSELNDNQSEFVVSTLFPVIKSIDGVDHIQALYLEKDQERYYDVIETIEPDKAFGLLIPEPSTGEIKVELRKNGRKLPIAIEEVRAKYDELNFKYHSSRARKQDLSKLYELPQGVSRRLDDYFSIQNQFPITYGINAFGVPDSASTEVKAKAKQLKSYLVIFEQFLTDFLANLASVKTLFSIENEQRSSYSVQLLSQQQIAEIDAIYPKNPFEIFKKIIDKFDDYDERKSRLLDYLLALYGEKFTQRSLRHFNYYYSNDEAKQAIVNNKIEYLKSIIELGRDRAAAPDYTSSSWSSGLQLRISMLLGFEQHGAGSMTEALLNQGIMCPDEDFKAEILEMDESSQDSLENVPASAQKKNISFQNLRLMIGDAISLIKNMLSHALLRTGIYIQYFGQF